MKIACIFLKGELAVWFEQAAQPCKYRWNKFGSSLERNFESFGADWESQMVKEFGNNTDDSSEGGLGRCEGVGPSNAPSSDARDASSDDSDDEVDPEEDTKEQMMELKPQSRV